MMRRRRAVVGFLAKSGHLVARELISPSTNSIGQTHLPLFCFFFLRKCPFVWLSGVTLDVTLMKNHDYDSRFVVIISRLTNLRIL